MKKFWTRTTTTAVLVAIILMLSAALLVQVTDPGGSTAESQSFARSSWASTSSASESELDGELLSGYDGVEGRVQSGADIGSSASTARSTEKDATRPARRQDLQNANSLVSELRRIVRAGNKMEVLRSTENGALTRRCFDGMKKLQSDVLNISKRRQNIAVSGSSVSVSHMLANVMKCVRCDAAAINYCKAAESDLNEIHRSLSIN